MTFFTVRSPVQRVRYLMTGEELLQYSHGIFSFISSLFFLLSAFLYFFFSPFSLISFVLFQFDLVGGRHVPWSDCYISYITR